MLNGAQLQITIQNSYFDIQNFVEPVQYFMDDQFFWDILPSFRKKSDLYVRKGDANTVDEYIQISGSNVYTYYTVEKSRDQLVVLDSSGEFMSVYFRFDATTENYDRKVFSFSDMLAQVGGLYQSVFMMGILAVGIFSERLFVSSILRKIYQIDEIRETHIKLEAEERKNKKKKIDDTENKPVAEQDSVHLSDFLDGDGILDKDEAVVAQQSFVRTIDTVDKGKLNPEVEKDRKRRIFDFVKYVINKRGLFRYSYCDILQFLCC